MTADLNDLTKAARALEHYDEEDHAENVQEYIGQRVWGWSRAYHVLKTLLAWSIVLAAGVIGIGGAADLALSGQYYAALGALFIAVVVYGWLRLAAKVVDAIADFAEDDIGSLEVHA